MRRLFKDRPGQPLFGLGCASNQMAHSDWQPLAYMTILAQQDDTGAFEKFFRGVFSKKVCTVAAGSEAQARSRLGAGKVPSRWTLTEPPSLEIPLIKLLSRPSGIPRSRHYPGGLQLLLDNLSTYEECKMQEKNSKDFGHKGVMDSELITLTTSYLFHHIPYIASGTKPVTLL